jgi:hypothetical protein
MLAIAATFLGCFLIFTLPDWTAAQINKQLPYWFYENEVSSLTLQVANVLCHEEENGHSTPTKVQNPEALITAWGSV